MNGMLGTWVQFVACALLIGHAGGKLARYGDILGHKAGWSAGFANKPDSAAGDIFGSCAFNLLILAMLDTFYRKQSLYCDASQDHGRLAVFGMALLARKRQVSAVLSAGTGE